MTHTFDESVLSDLHKEAYGFRPYASYYDSWRAMTDEEKQVEWDLLCMAAEQSERDEREAEARNHAAWQKRIESLVEYGAGDKATAIRWDMQAQKAEPGEYSFYCYACGLSWRVEDEIKAIVEG